MRASDPPVQYLVGTPKGRLSKLERALLDLPWQSARPQVRVKLLPQDQELYVFIESQDRLKKERGIRLRKLRELIQRFKALQQRKQKLRRDELLLALGQAKEQAGRVFNLVDLHWPKDPQADARTFTFKLRRSQYRLWRRREGRYLLRTNLTDTDPKRLWEYYLQLVEIEGAFKLLKDDLQVRPIYHQKESRVEAHLFVAFLAYCLSVTLRGQLRKLAGGLIPRTRDGRCWRNLRPSRWWTRIFQRPTDASWCSGATPNRRRTRRSCWRNWAGTYRSKRRRGSRPKEDWSNRRSEAFWCRPFRALA
jgi:hypothetical protein